VVIDSFGRCFHRLAEHDRQDIRLVIVLGARTLLTRTLLDVIIGGVNGA
jgi:hypothetical protein